MPGTVWGIVSEAKGCDHPPVICCAHGVTDAQSQVPASRPESYIACELHALCAGMFPPVNMNPAAAFSGQRSASAPTSRAATPLQMPRSQQQPSASAVSAQPTAVNSSMQASPSMAMGASIAGASAGGVMQTAASRAASTPTPGSAMPGQLGTANSQPVGADADRCVCRVLSYTFSCFSGSVPSGQAMHVLNGQVCEPARMLICGSVAQCTAFLSVRTKLLNNVFSAPLSVQETTCPERDPKSESCHT